MKQTPLFSLLILFLFSSSLKAQNWELGLMVGGASYKGDIDVNLKTFAPQLGLSGNIYGRKFITDHFSTRLAFGYAQLSGDEAKHPTTDLWAKRGFVYSGHIMSVSGLAEWRPFNMKQFQPYIFGGLSGVSFDGTTNFNEPNLVMTSEDIAKDKNAKYSKTTVFIPVGGGIHYFVSDGFSVGLEVSFNISWSDHLDGISLITGSKSKDYVSFLNLTFAKVFDGTNRGFSNRSVRCPSFN
jgi:opacity protein-like surface antigen